ncbi:MAG: signal peptidase I [Nitrospinae bacterium]|nr:signal peptidase I [Nitrospinota bacterium]
MSDTTSGKGGLGGEYVKAIAVALLLALAVRTYVVQAFKIPSESMVATLLVGDHLLVDKLRYRIGDPQRGDIVVFRYPRNPETDFVKRIVGLPGETLEVVGETVYIDGAPLAEPYARWEPSPFSMGTAYRFPKTTVPAGSYFMMGDNRNASQDSRYWGALPRELMHGKAFLIHWSWDGEGWGVRWGRLGRLLE